MKKLYLLRHAHAASGDGNIEDQDRPLNEVGHKECKTVGQYLKEQSINPDLVLCSSAKRTRETIALVIEAAGINPPVNYLKELYYNSTDAIYQILGEVDDQVDSVIIVSHNPSIHQCAVSLVKEGDTDLIMKMNGKFSPASFASFSLPIDSWDEIRPGSATLDHFVTP